MDESGIDVDRKNADLFVRSVRADSPGDLAGVQPGDVILAIDGEATTAWSLYRIWQTFSSPGKHTLLVRREGDERQLEFTSPDENEQGTER